MVSDLCDPNPVVTFRDATTPGTCPQEYSVTRTWTATDACGNAASCSQTISVTDNTGPTITCAPAAAIECPATPDFPAPMVSDLCDPNPVVTFRDATAPGTCPQEYSVTRTWTATDACGNAASCSQTISVTDTTAPTITGAPAAAIECPGTPSFPAPMVSDLCDPNPVLTFSDATTPGTCPQEYSVTRTWTATDACGNAARCSQTISVTDNTAPTITCAPAAAVECPGTPSFPAPMVSDLCDPNPVLTFSDATTPGTCPQEYSVTRTWTATDTCGNAARCSQTISVTDNTAPTITCAPAAAVECPGTPSFPAPMVSDLCDPNPVLTFSDATTPGTCPQEYSVTRTWTATDACGNAASCSQTISVTDNTAPTITCASAAAVECPATPDFPAPMVSDLCDLNPVLTFSDATTPGTCPQEYAVTRTWTATDACGNAASCSQTISVTDNTGADDHLRARCGHRMPGHARLPGADGE